MNLAENIFFWPDGYNSSLTYVRWDVLTDTVDKILTVYDESALAITEQGIITGQQSSLLNRYFYDIEQYPVFDSSDDPNQITYDDIDKSGLLLSALLKNLSADVKDQFGIVIKDDVEIVILDVNEFFKSREIRVINSIKSYTQHPVRLIDGLKLLENSLNKNKLDNADLLIISGVGAKIPAEETVSKRVHHLDFKPMIDAVTLELNKSGQTEKITQFLISSLLSKLMTSSDHDWIESSLDTVEEDSEQHELIDKLYLDNKTSELCTALFEKVNIKTCHNVYLVGLFSNYIITFLESNSSLKVKKFNRQAFIKYLLSMHLLDYAPVDKAKTISIFIDGEEIDSLEIDSAGCNKEILHTLKLFGKETEKIEIDLNDEHGKFIRWNIIVHTLTSLDIYDLAIQIHADSNFNLNCEIVSTDEIYISSKELALFDNDRTRPVSAVKELISIE